MSIVKKCENYLKQKRKTLPKRTVRDLRICVNRKPNKSNENVNWIDICAECLIRSELTFLNTLNDCLTGKNERTFSVPIRRRSHEL